MARFILIALGLFVYINVGYFGSEKVRANALDTAMVYNTAIKIKTKDMYDYALETDQGTIITGGYFTTEDGIKSHDFDGEYIGITKHTEEYRRHTRTVSDGKGGSKQEVYYQWDHIRSERTMTDYVIFFGKKYSTKKFNFFDTRSIDGYFRGGPNIRYSYDVIDRAFIASFIAKVQNNDIMPEFKGGYIDLKKDTVDKLAGYGDTVVGDSIIQFWFVYTLICLFITIVGFMINRYLKENRI